MTGCIQLYCGDGKGKTTAAIGLCVRAVGGGLRVAFIQFLKGRDSGELNILRTLDSVTLLRSAKTEKFTFQMDERELQQCYDDNTRTLLTAVELARSGEYDLVILDEVIGAMALNLLDEDLLRHLLEQRSTGCELVLTGRNPPDWLLQRADYVTEMCKRKHPYDLGLAARQGIEW